MFAPLKRPPQIAEEHDSATSLIASVEAGRGVALVQQGFDCLIGPRLKVRPLTPAPPPFVAGIAYRKDANAPAVEKSITAAKRAKSQQAEASTFDRCNNYGYIYTVRTSCRFAVAVHVLAVLAYKEGEAVTSARLAGSVNTNPVVIRRLLLLLQAAGVIETRKGAGAGSRLSRAPGRITLAEVYQAVETDEPFASHSKPPNKACPVGNCIQAALEKVFASAKAALQQELAKTNLADILESVQVSCARSGKGRK